MKVNKVQATIYIFEQLLKNEKIKKRDIQNVISISDVTFRRYIQELRAYLVNFDEKREIVFTKNDNSYSLF